MNMRVIRTALLSLLKISACTILVGAATNAQAGYYLVTPDPFVGCGSCEVRHVHHHYHHQAAKKHTYKKYTYKKPVKHYVKKVKKRSSASISVYYVYPAYYGYRCGDVYVPQKCDRCGRCSQPHYVSRAYEVYQAYPEDAYGYYSNDISLDTATADDGGYVGSY